MSLFNTDNYSMGDAAKPEKLESSSLPEHTAAEPTVVNTTPIHQPEVVKIATSKAVPSKKNVDRNGMPIFEYPTASSPINTVVYDSAASSVVIPERFIPEPVSTVDRNGMPIFDQPAVTFNYNRYSTGPDTYEMKIEESPGVVFNYNRFDIGSEHPEEDLKAVVSAQKKNVDHNGMPIFNYNQYNINSEFGSTTSNSAFTTKSSNSSTKNSYELP